MFETFFEWVENALRAPIWLGMRKTNLQTPQLNLTDFQDKSLLILDDDDPLRGRLSRAMEKKGFVVREAKSVSEGLEIVKKSPPNFAVIDLRLEDGNGLDVIKELNKSKSDCRIVMLTGYGNCLLYTSPSPRDS